MSFQVGILGAGQLGQMLALAACPLDCRTRFLDPVPSSPASLVAPQTVADFQDHEALRRFAAGLDVVTYEFENVPPDAVKMIEQVVPVRPGLRALEVSQDRVPEKSLCRSLGITTAEFRPVASEQELKEALQVIGYPSILKTRRLGYDGKGQVVLRSATNVPGALKLVASGPCILEAFISFDRELSLLSVRGTDGAIQFYPLSQNVHRTGILRESVAPAPGTSPQLERSAQEIASALLSALDYVGVLAIELFQCGESLVFNEMAPRVHNTGHWTIEGAETSQFENHLRAILGLPLGSTRSIRPACMRNFIGRTPDSKSVLAVSNTHLHLYGKTPRAGRKLGHVTLLADTERGLSEGSHALNALISDDG